MNTYFVYNDSVCDQNMQITNREYLTNIVKVIDDYRILSFSNQDLSQFDEEKVTIID